MVDLHVHSKYSDGFYYPEEVILMASQYPLRAVALTDHDTLDGIPAAKRAGRGLGVEIVPGVEVSATYKEEEIHILGYYPSTSGCLPAFLKYMKKERIRRAHKILWALNGLGLELSWKDITGLSFPATPGRLHFARLMLKNKAVTSIGEAFDLYLGKDRVAYVARRLFPAERVLNILRCAGAITVLAHPGLISRSPVEDILSLGVNGLEVFHPKHNCLQTQFFCRLARKHHLLITGGSDFHGDPQSKINRPGYISLRYHYLRQLRMMKK